MGEIETKKTEVREVTSDLSRMKGKFLVRDLKRSWTEDFYDTETGEATSISRHELIYERGTLLQAEELSRIQFYMNEGSIKEVEISNQKRMSYECKNIWIYPYIAKVEIDGKKRNIIMLANSVDNALEITKDYVELTYTGEFRVSSVKEYEDYIIIVDTMLKNPLDDVTKLVLDEELYSREEREQILQDEGDESKPESLKFYKIKARITYSDTEGKNQLMQSFIVYTYTAERGIMLIGNYLNKEQDKHEKEAVSKGNTFSRKDISTVIEESGILPVHVYIPKEFSEAYQSRS